MLSRLLYIKDSRSNKTETEKVIQGQDVEQVEIQRADETARETSIRATFDVISFSPTKKESEY